MKNKVHFSLIAIISLIAFSLPSTASAAQQMCPDGVSLESFSDFVCLFINLASAAIPVVIGLAFAAFIWGLAKFILHAGEESAREEGKQVMKWGIVALFVLVSIEGILLFLHGDVFNYSPLGLPQLPN